MADEKLASARATGAPLVTGGDLGCLIHLAGREERAGAGLAFRHVLELLVPTPAPALGEGRP